MAPGLAKERAVVPFLDHTLGTGHRPGVASDCCHYLAESSFLKLKPIQKKPHQEMERERKKKRGAGKGA